VNATSNYGKGGEIGGKGRGGEESENEMKIVETPF